MDTLQLPRRRRRKPKTPLGEWIVSQRESLGWKSEELAHRLELSDSTIRGWEAGRSVAPTNIEAMERLFGVTAPGHDDGSAERASLAAALSALAEELRRSRESREDLEGRLLAVEAELESLRARRADGAHEGPPVRDGSTG